MIKQATPIMNIVTMHKITVYSFLFFASLLLVSNSFFLITNKPEAV